MGPDRDDDGGTRVTAAPIFDLETAWVPEADSALASDGDWLLWPPEQTQLPPAAIVPPAMEE